MTGWLISGGMGYLQRVFEDADAAACSIEDYRAGVAFMAALEHGRDAPARIPQLRQLLRIKPLRTLRQGSGASGIKVIRPRQSWSARRADLA